MKNKTFWSKNAPYMADFIAFKRSLGYKYYEEERMLANFDKFMLKQNDLSIGIAKEYADLWGQNHQKASLYCYIA